MSFSRVCKEQECVCEELGQTSKEELPLICHLSRFASMARVETANVEKFFIIQRTCAWRTSGEVVEDKTVLTYCVVASQQHAFVTGCGRQSADITTRRERHAACVQVPRG